MKQKVRIIPRLDIKGPNVVKGINLEGLRVIGSPESFAQYYYENGADEILYIDSVASLYGRNSLGEIIERAASEIYIPLTVGGGIRTIEDVKLLLRKGADKVAINTALFKKPELITQVAEKFGQQCIIVSIQARKVAGESSYECLTEGGRENTGKDVFQWVEEVVERGAGELLITSVNQEGTGRGYDCELIRKISEMVDIPVIASGGAGKHKHVEQVIKVGKADAVSLASMFHYETINILREQNKMKKVGNNDFLIKIVSGTSESRNWLETSSIIGLKKYLIENNIVCRF